MQPCKLITLYCYASGFIHQAAYDGNRIVYARIVGKPIFVKSILAGLTDGGTIMVSFSDTKEEALSGVNDKSRSIFSRLSKQIGVGVYYDNLLFSVNDQTTYIIGKDLEFVKGEFKKLLKRRPVFIHDKWDMYEIYSSLNLISELSGFGVTGIAVTWDESAVNEHIAKMVQKKKLKI